jgi:hypothetical protein
MADPILKAIADQNTSTRRGFLTQAAAVAAGGAALGMPLPTAAEPHQRNNDYPRRTPMAEYEAEYDSEIFRAALERIERLARHFSAPSLGDPASLIGTIAREALLRP